MAGSQLVGRRYGGGGVQQKYGRMVFLLMPRMWYGMVDDILTLRRCLRTIKFYKFGSRQTRLTQAARDATFTHTRL